MGWLVAVLGGAVISLVLNLLYGLVTGFAVQRVVFTLSVVSIYLVSGFQAYLVSGYLVARLARRSGGLNGLIALFGLVTGLILAIVLGRLRCGLPRGCRGASCLFRARHGGSARGSAPFLFNLLGSYLGGHLGEPYRTYSAW